MFHWIRQRDELKSKGVIGLNRRNTRYIGRYNQRSRFPLVDNKLSTKLLAMEHGVSTPKLITTLTAQHEVEHFTDYLTGIDGFAVKPSKGSGGKGIMLVKQPAPGVFEKLGGGQLSQSQIKLDLSNILSGLYSLGGNPDTAVIEELLEPDSEISQYCQQGVPDIRVIVFLGFPVMAMVRLPTVDSDGKANLHQGAVGVGIDIASGCATQATQYNQSITHHPDTSIDISALKVTNWKYLLELASRCYDMTQLGYLGVDLVIDKRHGPMLLELNARPGLSIQIANGAGLQHRLSKVEDLHRTSFKTAESRVYFSQRAFRDPAQNIVRSG